MLQILFVISMFLLSAASEPSEGDDKPEKKLYGGFLGMDATELFLLFFALFFVIMGFYYAYFCHPVYCSRRYEKEYDTVDQEAGELQIARIGEEFEDLIGEKCYRITNQRNQEYEDGKKLRLYHALLHGMASNFLKR